MLPVDCPEAADERERHHGAVENNRAWDCAAGVAAPDGRNCGTVVAGNPGEEFDPLVSFVPDVEAGRRTTDYSDALTPLTEYVRSLT
ncbi:hypothetical protein ACQF36_37325 [Streptomyces sp. Marseille-Q5077]|uniref:hypothetical protein n=1 Tax=Streptomyces sp. Marseille-Q5077 TaxID=3418995 RepID=UPI003D08CCB6